MSTAFDGLAPISPAVLHRRRERVFLVMAGLFLGTLAMLNILGISRFIVIGTYADFPVDQLVAAGKMSEEEAEKIRAEWMLDRVPEVLDSDTSAEAFDAKLDRGPTVSRFVWGWPYDEDQAPLGNPSALFFLIAVGVLPYPLTFMCTDLISEFYGRRRANFVVWVGLILNLWVIFILWIGGLFPGFGDLDSAGNPMLDAAGRAPVFFEIRTLAFGAVAASMVAYLVAQFVDVHLFHFWKKLTKGRHLWLRNNGSTIASQLVDTTAVILITHFYAKALPIDDTQTIWPQLILFIATGYVFKLVVALLDTPLIYLAVAVLRRYLRLDPVSEHEADAEELSLYARQD